MPKGLIERSGKIAIFRDAGTWTRDGRDAGWRWLSIRPQDERRSIHEKLLRTGYLFEFVLALAAIMVGCGREPYPGDPTRATGMLVKDPNPVPLPNRVQIFSTLKEGDREQFGRRAPSKKWLRLETTNEVVIRSLVGAMRENAMDSVRSPPTNVVTYHIYFRPSDAELSLSYLFYYEDETNRPSSITAYSTAGNLWNAEGIERWFATNGLLPERREDR